MWSGYITNSGGCWECHSFCWYFGRKPKVLDTLNFWPDGGAKEKVRGLSKYVTGTFVPVSRRFIWCSLSHFKYSVAFVCLLQDTELLCKSFVWCIILCFLVSRSRPGFASVNGRENRIPFCYQCAWVYKRVWYLRRTETFIVHSGDTLRHPIRARRLCLHADDPAHIWHRCSGSAKEN